MSGEQKGRLTGGQKKGSAKKEVRVDREREKERSEKRVRRVR